MARQAVRCNNAAVAAGIFEAALERNSKDTGILREYSTFLATTNNPEYQDTPRALELARRAVELTQRDPMSLLVLARALKEAGKKDEAGQLLTEVSQKTKRPYYKARVEAMKSELSGE